MPVRNQNSRAILCQSSCEAGLHAGHGAAPHVLPQGRRVPAPVLFPDVHSPVPIEVKNCHPFGADAEPPLMIPSRSSI